MTSDHSERSALEAQLHALQERLSEVEAREARSASTLRFLDAMDRVNGVMRKATDLKQMLMGVLDEMLAIFECDRVWLLYPCDPDAPSWRVPMERTRAEWPGALTLDMEIPMDPGAAEVFAEALTTDAPLAYGPGTERNVPEETGAAFHIQAQMLMAVHPKTDRPWLLGLHHCAKPHVFGADEHRLFGGICSRIADSLSALITLGELRSSEQRFRTLVEHAPEAIVVMNAEGRLIDANPKAAQLFERPPSELLTLGLSDVSPEEQPDGSPSAAAGAAALERAIAEGQFERPWTCRGKDGEAITCRMHLVPLLGENERPIVRASLVDVSEREALEQQLRHLQKMEAIGELAAGVAHDFNNKLVVILCYAEMLRDQPALSPATIQRAERIKAAGEEAANLTRQLLAFARRAELKPRVVDMDAEIAKVSDMLRRVIGSNIKLTVTLSSTGGEARVRVDPQALEQVIVNLVTNAKHALPTGGSIGIVVTGAVDVPRKPPTHPVALAPGRYVTVAVVDDGTGMAPETASRVFEPFFTTKRAGQGTGLGLSTAYGVVQQSGGTIAVASVAGRGTTFTVYLPVAAEEATTGGSGARSRAAATGTETILLAEDNPGVAEVATQVLQEAGYTVLAASNGQEALALAAEHPEFDLLFSDVVMMGVDGVALATTLRERRPDLPVLFTTGYNAGAIERLLAAPAVRLLQKPYTPDQLLQKVRAALD